MIIVDTKLKQQIDLNFKIYFPIKFGSYVKTPLSNEKKHKMQYNNKNYFFSMLIWPPICDGLA